MAVAESAKTENSQKALIGAIFSSTHHTCGKLQLAVYLSRGDEAI